MGFERWRDNAVPLGDLARVVTLIMSPPNYRSAPLAGDRQDQHFDAWFDGGAIVIPTGGSNEYFFDDGVHVRFRVLAPRLSLSVSWPDGRAVSIDQYADHVDSEKDESLQPRADIH